MLYVVVIVIGFIFFFNLKKQGEKNKQLNEAVHQLIKMYESVDDTLKEDFLNELNKSEQKAFDKYFDTVISSNSKTFYKTSKNTKLAIQKLYQWTMKTQLKGQLKLLSLIKEDKMNQMIEKLDRKQKQQFEKLNKNAEKGKEIHLKEIQQYINSGLIKNLGLVTLPIKETLFSINDVIKNVEFNNNFMQNDFFNSMVLNNQLIQDMLLNNNQMSEMIHSMDAQMFNDQLIMNMNMGMDMNHLAMEESLKIITPFDHGGYLLGEGFNPSDTMAANAFHDMDQLNQLNNMNDLNNLNTMNNHNNNF